jgi:D-glycerate 3-kinase
VISLLTEFVQTHALPKSYIQIAEKYFIPLCHKLAQQSHASNSPLIIGIHGCQGSGKSTLTDLMLFLFSRYFEIEAVGMSIDDFYLTRAERSKLADTVHPLFQTRGVPGTHDTALLNSVLSALALGELPVPVPRFNKAIDDRFPEAEWSIVTTKTKIIILEGWCIGALPEDEHALVEPKNKLERLEDSDGTWRRYSNQQLAGPYHEIFKQIDQLIMLKAPGFHTVQNWRLEQEQRLVNTLASDADKSQVMDEADIARFIQHYQRITEHALVTLPTQADIVFELDESRLIVSQMNLEH